MPRVVWALQQSFTCEIAQADQPLGAPGPDFQTVTLTVMVTADPHVPAVPTGTVTFYDGCTVLGTATVNTATGSVSLTATLPAINGPQTTGQHTIQAIYGGDANFYHNNSNQVVVTVQ